MKETFFSNRIKSVLKALNLTQAGLASKLELSQGVISEFTSGSRDPSKEFILGLSKIGISIDWFLTGTGEMLLSSVPAKTEAREGYKVPLLSQKVSCGEGADWLDESNVKDYIDILSLFPRRTGRIYAFPVQGNSMVGAGIKNGDYVLFYADEDQLLVDDIYVFSLDGEVFCKQLEFDRISNKIKIFSLRVADLEKADLLKTLNAEDSDFADRFHIFGRVFSWLHPNHDD